LKAGTVAILLGPWKDGKRGKEGCPIVLSYCLRGEPGVKSWGSTENTSTVAGRRKNIQAGSKTEIIDLEGRKRQYRPARG